LGGGHVLGGEVIALAEWVEDMASDRPKTTIRGGVNESLIFLSKYLAAVLKSTTKRHNKSL
jgi:hypothetical protein